MITVKLKGGHSNQMFQYATARSLANRHKTDLRLDLSWFENTEGLDSPRHYELGSYTIYEHIYHPSLLTKVQHKLGLMQAYAEPSLRFDKSLFKVGPNADIDGDFQSEKYFADIRPMLIRDFSYKKAPSAANQKLLNKIEADDSAVSLHIRRGDYAYHPTVNAKHGLKSIEYYKKAILEVKKQVKNPSLYVISNDPAWCKSNLKLGVGMYIVENNDPLTGGPEDMRLMRACKHNILANSSFSWWGAWLNDNPNKIVVAPKQWFNDATIDATDLLPESWIRL